MKLGRYRKLIVALLGLSILFFIRYKGVEIPGLDALVIDLIGSALTAFGVYQVPNDPMDS